MSHIALTNTTPGKALITLRRKFLEHTCLMPSVNERYEVFRRTECTWHAIVRYWWDRGLDLDIDALRRSVKTWPLEGKESDKALLHALQKKL